MQQIKAEVCPLIPAKHLLIIADACFGGLLLKRSTDTTPTYYDMSYVKSITKEHVRQIITAGSEKQRVLDGGIKDHSVFTGRLIESLSNVKTYVTALQLGVDLKEKVYGDAAARGHNQTPQVGKIYGVGDFVFIPDAEKEQRKVEDQIRTLEGEINDYAD